MLSSLSVFRGLSLTVIGVAGLVSLMMKSLMARLRISNQESRAR